MEETIPERHAWCATLGPSGISTTSSLESGINYTNNHRGNNVHVNQVFDTIIVSMLCGQCSLKVMYVVAR